MHGHQEWLHCPLRSQQESKHVHKAHSRTQASAQHRLCRVPRQPNRWALGTVPDGCSHPTLLHLAEPLQLLQKHDFKMRRLQASKCHCGQAILIAPFLSH